MTTSDPVVERVARAIMDADPDAPYPWDSAPPSYRKAALTQAEAAIAAMSPPPADSGVVEAAYALIADVRRRYPGEELRCEYMRALDAALAKSRTGMREGD